VKPIPEVIVDKTWQEVAGFSPDRAKKEMIKIGNSQPELLAFINKVVIKIRNARLSQEVSSIWMWALLLIYLEKQD
jgi:hypothetical protein